MTEYSYFPGCSLATSAKESNLSLVRASARLNLNLIELEDWNCCGSSSAHSLDHRLALELPVRNLSLAPKGRPLMVMCPSCLHRLSAARLHVKNNPAERIEFEKQFDRSIDPDIEILHLFDVLDRIGLGPLKNAGTQDLNGLTFVSYYGCMLARPPSLRYEKSHHGLIEKIMSAFGAKPVRWGHAAKCCGTFLAAARPDIATRQVDRIIRGAIDSGAECIITACAMCQLNLEIRCSLKPEIPALHFSEILALALGEKNFDGWFKKHIVDPRPLIRKKGFDSG